jgi:hypothetical protein
MVLIARGVSADLSTGFGMRLAVGTERPWHCTNLFQIGCKMMVLVYRIGSKHLVFKICEGEALGCPKHQEF